MNGRLFKFYHRALQCKLWRLGNSDTPREGYTFFFWTLGFYMHPFLPEVCAFSRSYFHHHFLSCSFILFTLAGSVENEEEEEVCMGLTCTCLSQRFGIFQCSFSPLRAHTNTQTPKQSVKKEESHVLRRKRLPLLQPVLPGAQTSPMHQ